MRSNRFLLVILCLIFVSMTSSLCGQSKEAIRFYNKGQKSYQQRLLIMATVDYTEAISLAPDYIVAIEARGNVFLELGEKSTAIKDYESILSIDASHLMSKIHLMEIYASLDMNKEAIKIATLMMNKNSENLFAALINRGRFYEGIGNKLKVNVKRDYIDFLNIEDEYYSQFRKEIKERLRKL